MTEPTIFLSWRFWSGLGVPSQRPMSSYQKINPCQNIYEKKKKRVKVRSTACHYAGQRIMSLDEFIHKYKLVRIIADGNSRFFFSIYNSSIYWLFSSVNSIGLYSVVDTIVFYQTIYPGLESRWQHIFLMFFFFFFFFQYYYYFFCYYYYSANSTLLSLLRFSYFITSYDAQASSACSALIFILFIVCSLDLKLSHKK